MNQTTTPPFSDDPPAPPPGSVSFEEFVAWANRHDVRAEGIYRAAVLPGCWLNARWLSASGGSGRWPRAGAYWRSDHC
jgi:hypothetical protein